MLYKADVKGAKRDTKGYIYNEATVESPLEGIDGSTSMMMHILAYEAGQDRGNYGGWAPGYSRYYSSLRTALEIIVTGVCLDAAYGFAMPEGDGIIVGMEYAAFASGAGFTSIEMVMEVFEVTGFADILTMELNRET